MANTLKIREDLAEQYLLRWQEAKAEIERLRNYYEVDFTRTFDRIRELKDDANYFWDQYEKTRSIEQSRMNSEALAIYQVWCHVREVMREIQLRYDQTDDLQARRRLKQSLQRLQLRSEDIWLDLEQVY